MNRITRVESRHERVPLTRPYAIAKFDTSAVDLHFVRVVTDGAVTGVGAAAPAAEITGETSDACAEALEAAAELLVGRDPRHLGALARLVAERFPEAPAARAALDMALYDLLARHLDVPVIDLLGRCHGALPTSVTIGILPVDDTVAEAEEHVARGFTCLKVKIGRSIDEDLERLHRLRERVGRDVFVRVDANEGYTPAEARRLVDATAALDLELIEQPLPVALDGELATFAEPVRRRLALDESMHDAGDALRLTRPPAPCGVFVLKLVKCGGVTPALDIARVAHLGGAGLMWGCMDESVLGITAALHAAYASPATRFLDLDGSFDLAADPASGGFTLRDGRLELTGDPGLGVRLDEAGSPT